MRDRFHGRRLGPATIPGLLLATLAIGLVACLPAHLSTTSTSPTAAAATALPVIDGTNLRDPLLGTFFDADDTSLGWHFFPAGELHCLNRVKTKQSCLAITRLAGLEGTTPVALGPLVADGAILRLLLIHNEDGTCVGEVHEIEYEVIANGLRLTPTGCLSGLVGGDLIRGDPH